MYGIMSLIKVFRSWGLMYQKSSDLFGLFGTISEDVHELQGVDPEILARLKRGIENGHIVEKEYHDQHDFGG
jgi:hypothetical protein